MLILWHYGTFSSNLIYGGKHQDNRKKVLMLIPENPDP